MIRTAPFLLAGCLAAIPLPALAHAVLQSSEAKQDSVFKAVIALDHGCMGAATTAVHVTIPEGFIAAKPMPKAGWSMKIDTGPYAQPYTFKGMPLAEGAKTISWTGNLPADEYDEFVISGFVAGSVAAGSTLYLPVTQECGTSAYHWSEIPSAAASSASLAHPAPGIRIMASARVSTTVSLVDRLRISEPWAHASAAGATSTDAFVTIENRGSAKDTLTGVTSDAADSVVIAGAKSEDGDAAATKAGVAIPPGVKVLMRPGAYHLVLNGLKAPLKEGQVITATLTFATAGPLALKFSVASSDALSSGASMPPEDAPDRL